MTYRFCTHSTLLAAAILMSGGASAAETRDESPCSLAGVLLGNDIDFNAAVRRMAPAAGKMNVACRTVSHVDLTLDGARVRLVRARLFKDEADGEPLRASLVTIERVDGPAPRRVGWAVLPDTAADDETALAPQMKKIGDATLLRIAPRHRHIFRIGADSAERIGAFDWREALQVEGPLAKGGQALGIDLERMEGRIALVRDSADAPAGQSAYTPSQVAVAHLNFADGKLTVAQQSTRDRKPGDDAFVDEIAERDRTIRDEAGKSPEGAEPCALSGWSLDSDPNGLNVRAAPSASAKILGVVPPPLAFAEKDKSEFGVGSLRAEFRIVGYRAGWFLIEDVSAPGAPYGAKAQKSAPRPFKGRGWVSAGMVGAAQGNMGSMQGLLYRAPQADALFDSASDANGKPYGAGSSVAHLRACSGGWGFVETTSGSRGWTRGLCSNQVSECS